MIQRRTVLTGVCSLIASPALARAASILSLTNAAAPERACAVDFTIHGWDPSRWDPSIQAAKTIVSFQLTASWRADWL